MSLRDEIKNKSSEQEVLENNDVIVTDEDGVDVEKTQRNIRHSIRNAADKAEVGKPKSEKFKWVKM